jgi:hypothetical protein
MRVISAFLRGYQPLITIKALEGSRLDSWAPNHSLCMAVLYFISPEIQEMHYARCRRNGRISNQGRYSVTLSQRHHPAYL